MSEELYLRLYGEINAQRYDSRAADELLGRLGPPALLFRAYARARRHAWGSVHDDLQAALATELEDPRLGLIAGVACLVAGDYDRGLVGLRRVAERGSARAPKLAAQALELGLRHATALAWTAEARELRAVALELRARRDHGAARARAERARRERAAQACAGPAQLAAWRAYTLAFRDGPEAAEAALAELSRAHPKAPSVAAARLRLALLGDRLDHASALADALDERQREAARAELAALALAWGDADAALGWTTDPRDDPRLLYLRAAAVNALFEDFDYAAQLLEAARSIAPGSAVITLALALARHRRDPLSYGEALERSFESLAAAAPALLADAAASLGTHLWCDQGLPETRAEKVAILTRAQAMLSAEADVELSSYLRRSADGRLRLRQIAVGRDARATSHLDEIHRHDAELVARYEAELVGFIGVRPPAPAATDAAPPAPAEPATRDDALAPRRLLSDAQVEQFLADGYLCLRGAIDPARVAAMRAAALERLIDAPHEWVRGYERGPSLAGFDADDPATWTRERVELLGPETHEIEALSAQLWAAICDLLGGPERVETRTWGDYLILNLCADDPLIGDRPPPGASSWHIDDPNPVTRLDSVRAGLVGIVLFDELRPASGNTWLALDSVPRVARELAARPEGVDFVHERGNHITAQCQRFYSVEGQAGDVWLLHPLMMHSASPNRSGRIRWMSNPMVYMREPLDPLRARHQLSPVELAIRRAIDA